MKKIPPAIRVMIAVSVMYLVKILAKLWVGYAIGSPLLIGDGYHNASDLLEAMVVIIAVFLGSRPENAKYPFGLHNVECLAALSTGVGLSYLALKYASQSAVALASEAGFGGSLPAWIIAYRPAPPEVDARWLWVAVSIAAGSVLLSMVVGSWQIRVGKSTGHEAVVADGKETHSDGLIELAVTIGMVSRFFAGYAWFEHVLMMFVAAKMIHTGFGLAGDALMSLLQRSLDAELKSGLLKEVMALPGIIEVEDLRTFSSGNGRAVVMLKAVTRLRDADTQRYLKKEAKRRIDEFLRSKEMEVKYVSVRFGPPPKNCRQQAFVLKKDGESVEISTLSLADSLRFASVIDGMIVRYKDVPLTRQPGGNVDHEDMLRTLTEKRVETIIALRFTEHERLMFEHRSVTPREVEDGDLAVYDAA
jgi:cation diffusion facilitator family transporter